MAGQLELDAPVSRYLPGGYRHYHSVLARRPGDASDLVPAEVLAPMTVASLLNHSAGLPNWSPGALSPAAVPGRRWQYSGEGYVLLQSVMEAASGLDIADCIAFVVTRPSHVNVDQMIVLARDQAGAREVHRRR